MGGMSSEPFDWLPELSTDAAKTLDGIKPLAVSRCESGHEMNLRYIAYPNSKTRFTSAKLNASPKAAHQLPI